MKLKSVKALQHSISANVLCLELLKQNLEHTAPPGADKSAETRCCRKHAAIDRELTNVMTQPFLRRVVNAKEAELFIELMVRAVRRAPSSILLLFLIKKKNRLVHSGFWELCY